jgi:beta-glucuronidase
VVDPTARLRLADVLKLTTWREARVGLSWNAQFPDLRNYMGAAWYRIRLDLPVFRETQHVILKFGAVDYFCEVFVNGRSVGAHEGGYTPFSFEISSIIQPGFNELVVHVIRRAIPTPDPNWFSKFPG